MPRIRSGSAGTVPHPLDAAITLPDGRSVGIIRRGVTAERTAFAKRMRRLWEGDLPSALLLLAPDETRLRQARRLLRGAPTFCVLALEAEATQAGAGDPIWSAASGSARLSLREALRYGGPAREWPCERPLAKRWLAPDIAATDRPLASLLSAGEKRALDLIGDWPWIAPFQLGPLLGVKRSRLSQLLGRLTERDLVAVRRIDGRARLALTDQGIAYLARRDRSAVGAARRRWSAVPRDQSLPSDWRNVGGARSRQLLRHIEHSESVHEFVASLAEQAPCPRLETGATRSAPPRLALLPPQRPKRALRTTGCVRRPQAGKRELSVLPRMGAASRPSLHDARPPLSLPPLLRQPPTDR